MNQEDPKQQYLRYRDVCEKYGIGKSTLYRWINKGLFPSGSKIGPRAVRWNIEDLPEWRVNQ